MTELASSAKVLSEAIEFDLVLPKNNDQPLQNISIDDELDSFDEEDDDDVVDNENQVRET